MDTQSNNKQTLDLATIAYWHPEYQAYREVNLDDTQILSSDDRVAESLIDDHAEYAGVSPHAVRHAGLGYIETALSKVYPDYKVGRVTDLLTEVLGEELMQGVEVESSGDIHGVTITYTDGAVSKLRELYGDAEGSNLYDWTISALTDGAEECPEDLEILKENVWYAVPERFDDEVKQCEEDESYR
jgi:hypothetical protein|nr:MAG TPA: hypothetical protein [Caudoviricetes sp.]